LLAILLMLWTANNFQTVFWIALIPAFLAFGLMAFAVREPERASEMRQVKSPLSRAEIARLGIDYWWVVVIAAIFTLARFSEAFLILRAQSVGLPIALVPAVMVLMNLIYALAAYPAGVLSDRMDRHAILIAGLAVLIIADIALALSSSIVGVAAGVILWGLHMGTDAGPARCARRRYGASRAARHGLWHVQSSDWPGASRCQRHRRCTLGCHRPARHIPRRGRIHGHRRSGAPDDAPQRIGGQHTMKALLIMFFRVGAACVHRTTWLAVGDR
jgi:hypothetical protein